MTNLGSSGRHDWKSRLVKMMNTPSTTLMLMPGRSCDGTQQAATDFSRSSRCVWATTARNRSVADMVWHDRSCVSLATIGINRRSKSTNRKSSAGNPLLRFGLRRGCGRLRSPFSLSQPVPRGICPRLDRCKSHCRGATNEIFNERPAVIDFIYRTTSPQVRRRPASDQKCDMTVQVAPIRRMCALIVEQDTIPVFFECVGFPLGLVHCITTRPCSNVYRRSALGSIFIHDVTYLHDKLRSENEVCLENIFSLKYINPFISCNNNFLPPWV
jgi:hypothetical protein